MGRLLDIDEFQIERAVKRGRKPWREYMAEDLTSKTRLADLSDRDLVELAHLGQASTKFVYDLSTCVSGEGHSGEFDTLASGPKLRVLDIALFFIDQIRWECLSRIGWITGYAGEEYPLVELIYYAEKIKAEYEPGFPELKSTHPRYDEYCRMQKLDGRTMLRSMIPAGLAALANRV